MMPSAALVTPVCEVVAGRVTAYPGSLLHHYYRQECAVVLSAKEHMNGKDIHQLVASILKNNHVDFFIAYLGTGCCF